MLDSESRGPGFKNARQLEVEKLSPCSGSVALRQLNPIRKKGPKSFVLK